MRKFGVETKYADIIFRSRLEARWAAWFDRVKWPWEYEPIDLEGYIPDFILMVKNPVLVEVKPVLTFEELYQYTAKIERSGWDKEALILGAYPMWKASGWSMPAFGLLAERVEGCDPSDSESYWWATAHIFRCGKCGKLNFMHEESDWGGRICGHYDGNRYLQFNKEDALNIRHYWAEAANVTKWKPQWTSLTKSKTDYR